MSRSFGGKSLTTRPSMRISPAVTLSSPAIIRSRVDLPQPDGPTSTTNSPSCASRDTPPMTVVFPNALWTPEIVTSAMSWSRYLNCASARRTADQDNSDQDRQIVRATYEEASLLVRETTSSMFSILFVAQTKVINYRQYIDVRGARAAPLRVCRVCVMRSPIEASENAGALTPLQLTPNNLRLIAACATRSFDLVVVGSGAGGLSAAIAAARAGLETLVVEKTEFYGGSSAMSGGALWVPCTDMARRAGFEDSPRAVKEYLAACAPAASRDDRLDAFLEHGPRMIEFMSRHSPVRFMLGRHVSDYYTDA